MYYMCRIHKKALIITTGRRKSFRMFIKFLQTQQLTELSDFVMESGEFLSLFISLLLLTVADVADLNCSVLVISLYYIKKYGCHITFTMTSLTDCSLVWRYL